MRDENGGGVGRVAVERADVISRGSSFLSFFSLGVAGGLLWRMYAARVQSREEDYYKQYQVAWDAHTKQ